MRDIYKTAEAQAINDRYDISILQILELMQSIPFLHLIPGGKDAAYEAITTAFKYGYAMGSRAEKKQKGARK